MRVVRPVVDPALARLPKGWFAKAKPVVPRRRQLSAETAMESVERVGPTDPAVIRAARRSVLVRGGDDAAMLLSMLGLDEGAS